jgi:hypothetical protein
MKKLLSTSKIIVATLFLGIFAYLGTGAVAYAQATPTAKNSPTTTACVPAENGPPNECQVKDYKCNSGAEKCLSSNPIVLWLNVLINIMAGIVGVGAILMMVIAGIQYTTARDNPQAITSAKDKIVSVVIGLAVFMFLWAFLQWLIPGGVFT